MIISIVNSKGGVAKTTTAILLATALARRGHAVKVLDADPQGSAESWAGRAADSGHAMPFEVSPATGTTLKRAARIDAEFLIIDTPPGSVPTIRAALEVSDLVIVPTDAAPLDLERMWQTLDAATHRTCVVLFTQVNPQTRLFKEAFKIVSEQADVAVFETIIKRWQPFKEATENGILPRDLGDYENLANEVLEVKETING